MTTRTYTPRASEIERQKKEFKESLIAKKSKFPSQATRDVLLGRQEFVTAYQRPIITRSGPITLSPEEADKLVREVGDIPADIDSIILQHHERPDGSGFPHGIDATKISPLGALFILAHDLLVYKIENKGSDIAAFVAQLDPIYRKGAFKDVLKALKPTDCEAP